jgi:ABC-type multidrug transport system fused ATPase/permease subunit
MDGHDLRDFQLESLRRQIVTVPQDTFLFQASVADNIRFGRPSATDEEVEIAARAANAHEFVDRLPDRYQTLVGERGVKLSGGQRQRISVARAFLANGAILLLDEATSAVEPESERLIYESLQRLMKGRTAIVATHRLSTIQKADQILVLSSGQIVERGDHATLMKLGGLYERMVTSQASGEVLVG